MENRIITRRDLIGSIGMAGIALLTTDAISVSAQTVTNSVYSNNVIQSSDVYNIKDYGAIGNGDDATKAIKDAVAAATNSSYGGVIYFPSGKYQVSSEIQIGNKIKGVISNTNATVISTLSIGTTFSIRNTTDFVLMGIEFTGNINNPDTIFWLENNKRINISNCSFRTTGGMCLGFSNTTNGNVTKCLFYDTGKTAKSLSSHPSKPAIWVGEAPTYTNTNITISECIFDHCNWSGIYFFAKGGLIQGNIFESCGESSIFIDYNATNINIFNNRINNAYIVNIAGFGIECSGRGIIIANNNITNCDEAGIGIADPDSFIIQGNICNNNGKGNGSNEQKCGLLFRFSDSSPNGAIRGSIIGNIFTDNNSDINKKIQLYGIGTMRYGTSTTSMSGIIFVGNYLEGNKIAPVRVWDNNTFLNESVIFDSNYGYAQKPVSLTIKMIRNTGIWNISGVGFRPRHIKIDTYAINNLGVSKCTSEIETSGSGSAVCITQYNNKVEDNGTAYLLKSPLTGNTWTYATIAGAFNDGIILNVGYIDGECPEVKLLITCYP